MLPPRVGHIVLIAAAVFVSTFHISAQEVRPLFTIWELFEPSETPNGENESWGLAIDGLQLWWVTNPDVAEPLAFRDIVIHTVNFDGTMLDTSIARIGGRFNQQAYYAAISGSRLYVCGRSCRSLSLDLKDCDMFVACIARATGDTMWTQIIDGGFGYDEADGIAVQPNGDVVVTGWMDSGENRWDEGIVRLSQNGQILWKKTNGTEKNDHQDGHLVSVEGKLYGAGLSGGSVNDLITLRGFDGQSAIFRFDPETGSVVDSVLFGRNDPWLNFENALGLTADTMTLWVTGVTTPSENNHDLFVAQYNQELQREWYYTCCGPDVEAARSIVIGAFAQVVVVGQTKSFGAGGYDVVVVQLDQDGNEARRSVWGGAGDDEPLECIIRNSTLYIAGRTKSKRGDHMDAFLIAAPIAHTSVYEASENSRMDVAARGNLLTIRAVDGPMNVEVFNMLGEIVSLFDLQEQTEIHVQTGSYFIRGTDQTGRVSTAKVLITN